MIETAAIVTALIAASAVTSLVSTITALLKKSKEKPNMVTITIGDKKIEVSKDEVDKILKTVQDGGSSPRPAPS